MEQRIQKLGNSAQLEKEHSLPFPIEPLRAAPTTLPWKRVSNTSSDSRVNYPHVLSPAVPNTPDNSQLNPIPSSSRMNPSSGPITPNQQFIQKALNPRTRNLNTIVPSVIALTHSLCFELALDKSINFKTSPFVSSYPIHSYGFSINFVLFQVTMPKCKKILPRLRLAGTTWMIRLKFQLGSPH